VPSDELADQRGSGSLSRVKKAVAAFRISIVRSNSAFLRFNARISIASPLVTPGRWPASTSACRNHFRSVSAFIPSRPDTALIAAHSVG
jgi:hypothetical protein